MSNLREKFMHILEENDMNPNMQSNSIANQPIQQSMRQSMHQPVHQPMHQPVHNLRAATQEVMMEQPVMQSVQTMQPVQTMQSIPGKVQSNWSKKIILIGVIICILVLIYHNTLIDMCFGKPLRPHDFIEEHTFDEDEEEDELQHIEELAPDMEVQKPKVKKIAQADPLFQEFE